MKADGRKLCVHRHGGVAMPQLNSQNNNASDPKWKQLYQSAIVELDYTKLPQRVADARRAIFEELQTSSFSQERNALTDALHALEVLETMVQKPKIVA